MMWLAQVGQQPAMEAVPLVMEPESRLYTSPVLVLDFQSLYPSMVIAYNLCYSTCLGRPTHARAAGQPLRCVDILVFMCVCACNCAWIVLVCVREHML